jgi:hypothetical protein
MTSFEFNWNNKYPGKYPLVPIEDKWIEKDEINLHRTGNVSCLPFKKRWLDISATNGNNFNELQLLTEKDIKWLESLSKNPTLTQKKYEFPHELFEDILCEEDNLIKKENDKY